MTKNTKLYFIGIIALITVTIGLAFVTKNSFTGDYDLNKIKKQYNLENFVYFNILILRTVSISMNLLVHWMS